MKIVKNWRKGWRMFSVQAQAAVLTGVGAWQIIPDDLRAVVPQSVAVGMAMTLLVLGILGRFIDQPKVKVEK
jgi:hypothetical protein